LKKSLCALLLGSILTFGPGARAATTSWLRTEGTKVVDGTGREIVLGGMNVGSWLVEEMWMMPYETKAPQGSTLGPVKDHVTLWKTAQQRFGSVEANKLRTAMRNAWLTEADFRRIRAGGMNCVRLPFTYDLLQEPGGWSWIDKALDWAKANNLYVILDLHGAPGRQNNSDHSGESEVNRLFKDPALVRQTAQVWTQIATRYRDRPEVAGYDLLNEPMGAPDATTLYLVTDQLYRAVRAVDKRHIVIIEDGYKGIDTFPRPDLVGWDNVMLSWHHYRFDSKSEEEQTQGLVNVAAQVRKTQRPRPVPAFIGELQLEPRGTPNSLQTGLSALQRAGASWTLWNYKTAMRDGSGGMWGWYRNSKPLEALDIYRDSIPELMRKANQLRTENMVENTAMTAALRASAQVKPLANAVLQEVVPTARQAAVNWRYTLAKPADNWFDANFDVSGWQEGPGGFGGTGWNFEGKARTEWKTNDIWLRREFTLPANIDVSTLQLLTCHDDDAKVYINGVLAAELTGYTHTYNEDLIDPKALATIKPGKNILAVYCHQGSGDQYIDAGLVGLPATP
jgi:endoglucanase